MLGPPGPTPAYQTDIGVKDAIICFTEQTHLEKPRSSLRIMFFDAYGVFDTVQPHRLAQKLSMMQAD